MNKSKWIAGLLIVLISTTILAVFSYEPPQIVKFKNGDYAIRKKSFGKFYYYEFGPSLWYEYPKTTYNNLGIAKAVLKNAVSLGENDYGKPIN